MKSIVSFLGMVLCKVNSLFCVELVLTSMYEILNSNLGFLERRKTMEEGTCFLETLRKLVYTIFSIIFSTKETLRIYLKLSPLDLRYNSMKSLSISDVKMV
jgi:hypothetical protein